MVSIFRSPNHIDTKCLSAKISTTKKKVNEKLHDTKLKIPQLIKNAQPNGNIKRMNEDVTCQANKKKATSSPQNVVPFAWSYFFVRAWESEFCRSLPK
jgi:hypothetical protein